MKNYPNDYKQSYSQLLGIPLVLTHLQDAIAEGLPLAERLAFPERVCSAIEEGADLTKVWPKFAIRMLTRRLARLKGGNEGWTTQCRDSVATVIALCESELAAWSDADAAVAWSARSAWASKEAESAASAAESAAESAAWAARSAEYTAQADDLVELLKKAT